MIVPLAGIGRVGSEHQGTGRLVKADDDIYRHLQKIYCAVSSTVSAFAFEAIDDK